EADIFANQMKFVKPLSPAEVCAANVEAGSDTQLMIKSLVESYGLRIAATNTRNDGKCICAVSALEKIMVEHGYHVLDRVLRLIIGIWEGEKSSFSANVLNAMARLVTTYGDHLNDDLLKEKLSGFSIKSLIRMGRERRPGALGLAEVMVITYNGKKKNSQNYLNMKSLYDSSIASSTRTYDKALREEAKHYNQSRSTPSFDTEESLMNKDVSGNKAV
ncbi:MAG: hypothetical protein IKX97_02070, partial [Erysipelotrichaceae bacterium]|nr:hypothetical protein [Erysipelotrichaceae bacterium]